MKTQSGRSSLPTILLTFSLLLLVLAIGFVVGRVVVARAYLDTAPRFEMQEASAPDASAPEAGPGESPVPGRVYVPPPAPPPTPPEGDILLETPPEDEVAQPAEVSPGAAEHDGNPPGERLPAPAEARPAPAPSPPSQPRTETRPPARPQPAPPPPKQAPAPAYSLQVGVFTSLQGARQVVDELARTGYPSRIVPEKRGAQDLYRVLTGRYQTEYAARKALDRLRAEGFDAFLVQE